MSATLQNGRFRPEMPETAVSADQFEAALIRQRSMVVLIRRAEAEEKQTTGAWQQAEKNRHNNAHRALATFQRGFDKEAAG